MEVSVAPAPASWLRNPQFDLVFIVGVPALALGSGILVISDPGLFPIVLFLDLWLLGYHHVISTYSRIAFDAKSFEDNKFLVVVLPVIVAVCVGTALLLIGMWTLVSVYLYWQWWHYTRQSYGISRIYARKSGVDVSKDQLTTALVYTVPTVGILYRSYQAPAEFLFLELKTFPVPYWMVFAVGLAAGIIFVAWIAQQVRRAITGNLRGVHVLYVLSHVAIFSIGYLAVTEINYGWLILNIWHNAQYILLVWFYNNNRFKNGIDNEHWLISQLSQRRNVVYYFAFSLGISTILYWVLSNFLTLISTSLVVSSAVTILTVYQIINFHHYIVDSRIWKVRKPILKQNLGLEPSKG
jgi:hypothetical protein